MVLDFGRVLSLAWPARRRGRQGDAQAGPCCQCALRPQALSGALSVTVSGPFLARTLAVPRAGGPAAYGICKRDPAGPGLRSHDKADRYSELARVHHGLINYQSRRNVMTFSTCFVCGNMSNGEQSRTR